MTPVQIAAVAFGVVALLLPPIVMIWFGMTRKARS